MDRVNDICSLDYLIGTLSTAYKGVITSLVAKDFCMIESGDTVKLQGTVLSIPEGAYEVSLLSSGTELARTTLEKGHFDLLTGAGDVDRASNLQIDIVQSGRHIGTFLLKKEGGNGAYVSAVQLSQELKGMDFRRLTAPLHDKSGLLRKAEEIITKILSTKKDWDSFSELLHGFAADLFWSVRDAFFSSYPILAHYSFMAAKRSDPAITSKPVANVLDLISLPLERETDADLLRQAVALWLAELKESQVDLSPQFRAVAAILFSIHEKYPDIEIAPALIGLVNALRQKIGNFPALGTKVVRAFETIAGAAEYEVLAGYGEARLADLMHKLDESGRVLEGGSPAKVFEIISGIDSDLLDDRKMVSAVYEVVARNITAESADVFAETLMGIFSLFPQLSHRALNAVLSNAPIVMEKFVSVGRTDVSSRLLSAIAKTDQPVRDRIVMDRETAKAVLGSGDERFIEQYVSLMEKTVIPPARVKALSPETWAELADPLHLERITKFMDILQLGGGRLRRVLAHVIANLYLSGAFIPDDRLFQRNISAYLNSNAMRGDFLLNILLLRKLPVYFNEVGAVSTIRDLSTELDSWGNDPVLYFVRKQVHVNASSYNVRLLEKVLTSWVREDSDLLRGAVPNDVLAGLKPALLKRYGAAIRPFFESINVVDGAGIQFDRLLAVPADTSVLGDSDGKQDEIPAKVMLLSRLYREIVGKYALAGAVAPHGDISAALTEQLDGAEKLVRIVRDPEKTAAEESLYFKRHIAFGIPSVLGTYHEPKFDALGELLRKGAVISVLLEQALSEIEENTETVTADRISGWLRFLKGAYGALRLYGLENAELAETVTIMETNRLRCSQVADLLKVWQKELGWIVGLINRTFYGPLTDLLDRFPKEDLPEYLMNLDTDDPEFTNKAADIVIRNIINSVPGFVETDRLIERLVSVADARAEQSDDELNGHLPEEDRQYFVLSSLSDRDAARLAPCLGGKAKNLVYLMNRGFRVPPGVTFSAAITKQFDAIVTSARFEDELRQAMKQLEDASGRRFGSREKPLFVSVRSGSYVSMPGILSTILFCGMNRETLKGFIRETGDPRLGWDSYRRFVEQYAIMVLGLDTGVLEGIAGGVLQQCNLANREACGSEHLEQIVTLEFAELSRRGLSIPEDVFEQLRQCMRAIYASWYGERARQFRKATRTSEHWGTAVTLVQMVPGNAAGAGASIFFTRNPFTFEPEPFGETKEGATGDDLVYGRYQGRPLSKDQAGNGEASLEERDPDLFQQHVELARRIEQEMGGLPQEVEATYTKEEDGTRTILVLQTRRMEPGAGSVSSFDEICNMEPQIIGRGVSAHGGAVSGVASFARTQDAAQCLAKESGMPVILLRRTANTEDVSLMPAIRGIVTASGGVTSHAAVLAQKFGVAAVVSCRDLLIEMDESGASVARIGNAVIREGTPISVDGTSGLVFSGTCFHTTNERS